jgi:hypothetical protein
MAPPKGHARYPGAGRKLGTPNKMTIKKAEAIVAEQRKLGNKIATDIMAEVMNFLAGLGAKYQPRPNEDTGVLEGGNESKCVKYLKMAADIAAHLASFQSPKLQSTTLRGDSGTDGRSLLIEIEYVKARVEAEV